MGNEQPLGTPQTDINRHPCRYAWRHQWFATHHHPPHTGQSTIEQLRSYGRVEHSATDAGMDDVSP